ncbi:MAG: methyltransferase domain-containing protein [candidate division Zixibacteria bacterium]|nr:methyltransferase domain-containing protein [candidate division Zixibacteria bacterium]
MIDTFTSCPICESNIFQLLFTHKKFGKFVKCSRCDLIYVRKRPTHSWIKERQKEPYRSVPIPDVIINREIDLTPDFQDILKRLKQYQSCGKLLELGSFTGHFLNLAKEIGYEVAGVEPDSWSREYARRHFSLNVYESLIQDLHFDPKIFGVIVMIHVLEHLTEPTDTLLELRRILNDNGILVIEVPIIGKIFFRLLGKYHRHIVMDHILLFSQTTLLKFLDKCGFYPIHSELVARRIRLGRIAWNFRNYSEQLGKFLEGSLKILRAYDLCIKLNLRDIMRLYCRKTTDSIN